MNIGLIPLRKGSKGIPNKNKRKLLGRPLFSWTLYEASKSNLDKVYIFTDDDEIIDYISNEYKWNSKIFTLSRSRESSTDMASTEYAMKEFVDSVKDEITTLTLIQATSPLLTFDYINKCIDAVISKDFDSALTVAPIKRFFWTKSGESINYNYLSRPRRQDFDFDLVENGACYTVSKDEYDINHNRLGGRIKPVLMGEDSFTEIDEPNDFVIIRELLKNRLKLNKKLFSKIKLVVLDVDGVFTDSKIAVSPNGEFSKAFSMKDGMALELLRSSGIDTIVITSEVSSIVEQRMKKLKIDNLLMGVKDKYSRLDDYLKNNNLLWGEVAYIGDDINDLTNIVASGVSFAPSDANIEIIYNADIVLNSTGGNGAIREMQNSIFKLYNY